MHRIVYYCDRKGNKPVADYMRELAGNKDKDSRIKLDKIAQYVKVLEEKGTRAGEPFVKHLDGEIWEMRPIRDRILFAAWVEDSFVLLHCFLKQTQKTPQREIAKAKRELADFKERWGK